MVNSKEKWETNSPWKLEKMVKLLNFLYLILISAVVVVENCDIKFEVNPSFLEVRGSVKNANTLIMTELNELPEDDKEPFGISGFFFKKKLKNF